MEVQSQIQIKKFMLDTIFLAQVSLPRSAALHLKVHIMLFNMMHGTWS